MDNRILIAGIMLVFIFIFIYIEPILSKRKVKNKNDHGSARFSSKHEIKNNFKCERINNINESGFPILFNKKLNKIYFDRETPHYVY